MAECPNGPVGRPPAKRVGAKVPSWHSPGRVLVIRGIGVCWLYVLRSMKDGRLYTGIALDRDHRLREHNAGRVRSTRSRRPFVLVYSESFQTRAEAMARERYFKTPEGGALKQRLVRTSESDDNRI